MATFVMLSRLSPEGMKTLRDNPERIQEVNREVERLGARVVQQYALLGHHDFITVLEAPDAETVSRVSVELSSRATASYETLPAIEVDEFVARLRGEGDRTRKARQAREGGQAQGGGQAQEVGQAREVGHVQETSRPAAEPSPATGHSEGIARSTGGAESEPTTPREQAWEDVKEIEEEIQQESEEAPRRRTEEGSPRTEEATPRVRAASQVRHRGGQPGRERDEDQGDQGEQPERNRDEDRGLVDKAKDAVTGSEEPRRREGTERSDRG
jgi:uncharacterized protein with GYD domain